MYGSSKLLTTDDGQRTDCLLIRSTGVFGEPKKGLNKFDKKQTEHQLTSFIKIALSSEVKLLS